MAIQRHKNSRRAGGGSYKWWKSLFGGNHYSHRSSQNAGCNILEFHHPIIEDDISSLGAFSNDDHSMISLNTAGEEVPPSSIIRNIMSRVTRATWHVLGYTTDNNNNIIHIYRPLHQLNNTLLIIGCL